MTKKEMGNRFKARQDNSHIFCCNCYRDLDKNEEHLIITEVLCEKCNTKHEFIICKKCFFEEIFNGENE